MGLIKNIIFRTNLKINNEVGPPQVFLNNVRAI